MAAPALALPTMIRLGYAGCASCHLATQGGGPLNDYGRGIDEAQSLRANEYRADDEPRRLTHDVRLVLQNSAMWVAGASGANTFRPRVMYRNVTALSNAFRVSGIFTVEGARAPRPARSYDPAASGRNRFPQHRAGALPAERRVRDRRGPRPAAERHQRSRPGSAISSPGTGSATTTRQPR